MLTAVSDKKTERRSLAYLGKLCRNHTTLEEE